jgi:hypothetical protein
MTKTEFATSIKSAGEPSDGSSADRKSMTYLDAVMIHLKQPMAASTKMEASGGSKYKMCCIPQIARR